MKKLLFLSIVSLGLVFASCRKDFETDPVTAPATMEDLKVPSNFDWKTTKDYYFTVKGNNSGLFQVISNKGTAYHRAFLTPGQTYSVKIALPAFEKEVKLLFMGQEIMVELDKQSINLNF